MRGVEGALTAKGHVTLFGHLFFMIPVLMQFDSLSLWERVGVRA
jgi:hypothetical protein